MNDFDIFDINFFNDMVGRGFNDIFHFHSFQYHQ